MALFGLVFLVLYGALGGLIIALLLGFIFRSRSPQSSRLLPSMRLIRRVGLPDASDAPTRLLFSR